MTKIKAALNDSNDALRHPKNGSIHKKKQQKFKNTPTGKVSIINGSGSKRADKQMAQKNGDRNKSSKGKKLFKGKGSEKNGVSPKRSPKKKATPEEEEDDDDSDEDINEGISIREEISEQENEVDDDDDSSDDADVPDIFGTSLANETDDSDEEFDVEGDEAEIPENKGVKMFRGTEGAKKKSKKTNDSEEDEDEEDNEEESDEDDQEEQNASALGLSALLGDSIKDESGDEDFVGAESSEDDDDEEDDDEDDDNEDNDDESEDEAPDQSLNSSKVTSNDEDSEDDDDDDDDDESSPDLSDLLGNSLADDSNDDDFQGDEDDEEDDDDSDSGDEDADESALSSKKTKTDSEDESIDDNNESHDSTGSGIDESMESHAMTVEEKAERKRKTIFVGNVPKEMTVKRLSKEFKKFGPVDTVRIRGIVPEDPKMSLKVAAIKKKYHPKITSVYAYIVFKNEESVAKALSMNGKKLDGNYLRVDHAEKTKEVDKKKSVFLGNLPFTIEDNELWEAFKGCGRIESVSVVRDGKTGLGRGFGFINFETTDGAVLALGLQGTTIRNREVRIKAVGNETDKKQKDKQNKKRRFSGDRQGDSPKKIKTDDAESVKRATHNSLNAEKRKKKSGNQRSQGEKQRMKGESISPRSNKNQQKFQGQTADAMKKQKQDKTSKKKKQMAAKLLAKPKKPSAT